MNKRGNVGDSPQRDGSRLSSIILLAITAALGLLLGTDIPEEQPSAAPRAEVFCRACRMKLTAADVLEKVTLGYGGDFTEQYALDNDFSDFEKETWVNAKGFVSRTEYLIWVNLAYQRVNIFTRSGEDGLWELVRSCIVSTGAGSNATPDGTFYVNGKQESGWNMTSFTVH